MVEVWLSDVARHDHDLEHDRVRLVEAVGLVVMWFDANAGRLGSIRRGLSCDR
jgi:hypothetical protein